MAIRKTGTATRSSTSAGSVAATLGQGVTIQPLTVSGVALPVLVASVNGKIVGGAYNTGDGTYFAHTIKNGKPSPVGREMDAAEALDALINLAG